MLTLNMVLCSLSRDAAIADIPQPEYVSQAPAFYDHAAATVVPMVGDARE